MKLDEQVKKIAESIKDKKAKDIVVINVEKMTSATSYFVLATATSTTQARGVINYVEDELSKLGIEPIRKDVKHYSEWLVLDYGDIIVHLMTAEVREFYNIEKLWVKGDNVINF